MTRLSSALFSETGRRRQFLLYFPDVFSGDKYSFNFLGQFILFSHSFLNFVSSYFSHSPIFVSSFSTSFLFFSNFHLFVKVNIFPFSFFSFSLSFLFSSSFLFISKIFFPFSPEDYLIPSRRVDGAGVRSRSKPLRSNTKNIRTQWISKRVTAGLWSRSEALRRKPTSPGWACVSGGFHPFRALH